MAAPITPSLSGTGSRRRLSLRPINPAGGVLAHPGARPARDGTHLLRRGDPREFGHWSAEPGEPDLRPQDKRCTPGRFRTRVITNGVVPSLHIDYKKSR